MLFTELNIIWKTLKKKEKKIQKIYNFFFLVFCSTSSLQQFKS